MKQFQILSFLAVALTLSACNETISPELEKGNSIPPTSSGTPVPPSEYIFKVTNNSDVMLNFKLHKTGAGHAKTDCQIKDPNPLTTEKFSSENNKYDITCFFEAEELSLYHSGFAFDIEASKNTCDFVGYSPFSFYKDIPGNSSATYYNYKCLTEETNDAMMRTLLTENGYNHSNASGDAECNDYLIHEDIISAGTRKKFQVPEGKEAEYLCRFNHEFSSCDIGSIIINELRVTYIPAEGDTPEVRKVESVEKLIDCGGSVLNCIDGPIKELTSEFTRMTEISRTSRNESFRKGYSYPGLIDVYPSTRKYVNFRRNLANKDINFIDTEDDNYNNIWSDSDYNNRTFEPEVMDYFANNLQLNGDGTPLINSARLETEAIKDATKYARPLAADPFLGLSGKINPFYTFYCFDRALDIRARIRMVVRDWDRVFPENADLELLSDLGKGSNARQDNNELEMPNQNDVWIQFNDKKDWDDLIPMARTAGSFNPASTIWTPFPWGNTSVDDGWFNPKYFPDYVDILD